MAQGFKDGQTISTAVKMPTSGQDQHGEAECIAVDNNGAALQGGIFLSAATISIAPTELTAGAVSSNVALPAGLIAGDILRVVADGLFAFKFGVDNTVTAAQSDNVMLAVTEYRVEIPAGMKYIAGIRMGASDVHVAINVVK